MEAQIVKEALIDGTEEAEWQDSSGAMPRTRCAPSSVSMPCQLAYGEVGYGPCGACGCADPVGLLRTQISHICAHFPCMQLLSCART